MNNQTPSSYNCQISEYQRVLIRDVLQTAALDPETKARLTTLPGEFADNQFEELQMLVDMLADLQADEQDTPGCIHGLCL